MSECRNCGSLQTRDLGFIGEVAPFFLKRVFHLEVGVRSSGQPLKRRIQSLTSALYRVLSRVHPGTALVEIEACLECSFIQTRHGFPDEALQNLYSDYRSDTYNRERIHYEPNYRQIAGQVGSGEKETETRIADLTAWLKDKITPDADFTMLDYGGADGRFLPRLPGRKYVFEISDLAPAEGITSIRSESDLSSYSFIQLAHILEHVSRPLELVRKVSRWLAPDGYLYIEVPQDFDDLRLKQVSNGTYRGPIPIHEHINFYSARSISKLLDSAGLATLKVEPVFLDLGWTKTTNIRALARKR